MSFENALITVSSLVKDFKDNEGYYLSQKYSEADTRNDFINKFFIALGWDVRHEEQKNPYEQEVRVEKPLQIAKAQKRADYSFSLKPNYRTVKFFVEAKKPAHDLSNIDYYFQTARYGWNAGTPVAVLTDFEEFHIVDCRFRPNIDDALNYKIKQFHYSDFTDKEKFSEIYWIFSREAVADGSIEKYAAGLTKPKGKRAKLTKTVLQSIDEAFLEELDEIRNELAKSFKKNNEHLSSEELTEATQRTIDRLVFIKFLEDKLIEPDHYVSKFANPPQPSLYKREGAREGSAWEKFLRASRTLDAKYNGIVFKKSLIDTRNVIEPDDKTFSAICDELSHENTPYNFDAIPIHILGSIYERFLGKVVHATDKRATIEEKPEVRKAGGVYYTPQYIVDYIVSNTVGKLIVGKTPRQIAKIRFADIACGSGSFLITVFETLLDYHKKFYLQNTDQAKKDGCILYEDVYRLSLKQKQLILTNNIYGIDIDQQAVEVTQLSLYLKLLEDETTATANDSWVMFKEQLLPDLNKNIVCGNSLIGTDILGSKLFEYEEEKKIKPMDFENVFPEVMSKGGFDAIVGNPPYIPIESFSEFEKKYYQNKFPELRRKFDSSVIFILKALSCINNNGLLGYISTQTWETGENYTDFREKIFKVYGCVEIINLPFNIFKDAYVDTGIFILSSRKQQSYRFFSYNKKEKIEKVENLPFEIISTGNIIEPDYKLIFNNNIYSILLKLSNERFTSLGNITTSTQGLSGSRFSETKDIKDKWTLPFYNATVKRYAFTGENSFLVNLKKMKSLFPYYEKKEKILIRRIINRQDRLDATYYNDSGVFKKDLNPFIVSDLNYNTKYLLALINSTLFSWLYLNSSSIATKDDFRQTTLAELRKLPIKRVDSNPERSLHDQLITLVDQMLEAKRQLQQAKTESEKTYLERKCDTLEKQIDEIVYQLYGLTEEEIKIVEESVK